MNLLLILFFTLIPFSHLFFRTIDIWHAQGHFFQTGLLIIFAYSFFERQKYIPKINRSLGFFIAWAGLVTASNWITVFAKQGKYPIKLFMPFFNLICAVILYKLCVEYLNEKTIEKILKYLSYVTIALLFYCVIQYLQLDEFFKELSGNKDELVGTIGNSSHLAGYLALCQPLFFDKGIRNILALTLLWIILLLLNSASGVLCGIAVIAFYLFFKKLWNPLACLSGVSLIGGVIAIIKFPSFFSFNHRFEIWADTFELLRKKAITGYGLGMFGALKYSDGGSTWRHLHNEPLQVIFELGLIGLGLLLYVIWEYFKNFKAYKTDLSLKITSIFFGFCFLSLFTFNAHLWIVSALGIMAYSFLYALKNNSEPQVLGAFK